MNNRERRIAEAVRDACVAEFQTRADDIRTLMRRETLKDDAHDRAVLMLRQLDANAALLRAVDVAAVVAMVPAEAVPSSDRCPRCDKPIAKSKDYHRFKGGEGGHLCWSGTACPPADWRGRALAAEARLAKLGA